MSYDGGYQLEGPKPARMYEVLLPKKLGYYGKIEQVLQELFQESAIREVPFVQHTIAERLRRDPNFDDQRWLHNLSRSCRGYSIYEMDGRFVSDEGPVDERVLVFRFIFHNPGDFDADNPKNDFLEASLEVINYLVAHRFAEELGVEEEIWFVEYGRPQLAIWRRRDVPDERPGTSELPAERSS